MITAAEFVEKLATLAPDQENVSKTLSLEFEEAKTFVNPYFIKRRKQQKELTNDPILDLIHNYESQSIEIGFISFFDELYYFGENIAFASVIDDDAYIDLDNGEVRIADRYDSSDILHYCAQDTESFLEMLLIYADFEARQQEGTKFNLEERTKFFDHAVELAGGIKYAPFLKILFSIGELIMLNRTVNPGGDLNLEN